MCAGLIDVCILKHTANGINIACLCLPFRGHATYNLLTLQLFEEGVDTFIKRGQVSYSPGRTSLLLQPCHDGDRLLDFLRNLLLPFVLCMYVVCHQLLSLRGGVQSLGVTVKHAQLLAASAVWHGEKLSSHTIIDA